MRAQADLVVDPHLGHDQAEVAGHPVADRAEPVEQVAAAGRVGQRDQAIADLQLERIDVQQVFHPLRGGLAVAGRRGAAAVARLPRHRGASRFARAASSRSARSEIAATPSAAGERQKRHLRQAR